MGIHSRLLETNSEFFIINDGGGCNGPFDVKKGRWKAIDAISCNQMIE